MVQGTQTLESLRAKDNGKVVVVPDVLVFQGPQVQLMKKIDRVPTVAERGEDRQEIRGAAREEDDPVRTVTDH